MSDKPLLLFRLSTLLLLLALTSLFAVSAGRGFDMTDEGYYLLNFLYWREFKAIFSMFGAYLSLPFLLFGKSIVAVRLAGFVLVVASSVFFGQALLRVLSARVAGRKVDILFPALVLSCCSVNHFGPFMTLVTPSYNTLALASILVATGLLLQFASVSEIRARRWISLAYGISFSVCFFDKFSASIVLGVWHLAIAWSLRAELRGKFGLAPLAWAALGFLANFIALLVTAPDMLHTLLRGIQYQAMVYPRNVAAEMRVLFLSDIPRSVLEATVRIVPLGILALVTAYMFRLRERWIFDLSIVALVAFVACYPNFQSYPARNSELFVLAIVLWLVRRVCANATADKYEYRLESFLLLIVCLPFAYSIGTNLPFLFHTAMAIVFPFAGCIALLWLLNREARIRDWSYYVCLVILGSTAIIPLLRPWVNQAYTYQLGTSLREQIVPTPMAGGASSLMLDDRSSTAFSQYREILRKAGFKPGMPMIDFTSMPGLAFLAEGVPVVTPCVFANFPGSTEAAQWVLKVGDAADVKRAWLTTSEDYIGRLDAHTILDNVIGGFPYQLVGEFVLPYANQIYGPLPKRATQDVTIKIWRPLDSPRAGPVVP